MNKNIVIMAILLVAIVVVLGVRFFLGGNEDNWICQNGVWIKHGNPSASMPEEPCDDQKPDNEKPQEEQDVILFSPKPNETVSSPILLQGKARGSWFFEASFPVSLVDSSNKELARSHVEAIGDWMTEDYVEFKGILNFEVNVTTSATLVLEKDNPSGLPENAGKIEVSIILSPAEVSVVKVFFNNDKLDPEFSCNKVFSVERKIEKTAAVARAALEELLKGPIGNEKDLGFFTSMNQGVKIQKLTIENGVAKVDFDDQVEFQVGGSCRVSAIRAQITETLKQFSTVKDIVISIDGRIEDILQP